MRSNPFDSIGRLPGPPLIGTAIASLIGIGLVVFAVHADRTTTVRREHDIQAVLAARGLGHAHVQRTRGPYCGRASAGFRWETATASGTACAGPVDRVRIVGVDSWPQTAARPSPPSEATGRP